MSIKSEAEGNAQNSSRARIKRIDAMRTRGAFMPPRAQRNATLTAECAALFILVSHKFLAPYIQSVRHDAYGLPVEGRICWNLIFYRLLQDRYLIRDKRHSESYNESIVKVSLR